MSTDSVLKANDEMPNHNSKDYNLLVRDFHPYDTDGIEDVNQSPRDVINESIGKALTGRKFSEYLLSRGMTLKAIAALGFLEVDYDGIRVVGRNIIFKAGINIQTVEDMTHRMTKEYQSMDTTEHGRVIFRLSDNGKLKEPQYKDVNHVGKKYKRNRRKLCQAVRIANLKENKILKISYFIEYSNSRYTIARENKMLNAYQIQQMLDKEVNRLSKRYDKEMLKALSYRESGNEFEYRIRSDYARIYQQQSIALQLFHSKIIRRNLKAVMKVRK